VSGEEPVPLQEILGEVRRDLAVPEVAVDGRLAAAWAAVAGPLASEVEVRGVRAGVLTVVAPDPARASRLRHQERALLEGLAALLGSPVAHRLRVLVGTR
jgi:predicted nucleic acid-binding Zn ribbon protein